MSRLWLAMVSECINSWLFSHVKCSRHLLAYPLLVSFPPSLGPTLQLCNGPRTRLVLGWHCTLYVVIGIITQTLWVIGMSQANIDKLERVRRYTNLFIIIIITKYPGAGCIVGARRTSSSLNIRRDLHWLPVGHRITYKLCLTTWKTLHTSQPL